MMCASPISTLGAVKRYTRFSLTNLANIPVELSDYNSWVCWREDPPPSPRAKPRKRPIAPRTGIACDYTDPKNQTSREVAVAAYSKNSRLTGIGFVLSENDPYAGFDLDKCRDPKTGEISPWAVELIRLIDSYHEISPSETGVKILVRGSLAGKVCHFTYQGHEIEVYDSVRYFALTGRRLPETPTDIQERQDKIDLLVPNQPPQIEPSGTAIPRAEDEAAKVVDAIPDDELIARIERSAQGKKFKHLMAGSTDGYPGYFASSGALCTILAFWTRCNPETIDRLYRKSGLFEESWWDERVYKGQQSRAEVTIAYSCARAAAKEMYVPLTKKTNSNHDNQPPFVEDLKTQATQTKAVAILRNAGDIEPIQVKWLWHEKIPYGMITLFAGNPGNCKSMASVACAAICSTGGKFPATPFSVATHDVLMLIGEDDIARTVVPRLKAANANMERIYILDAVKPVKGEDRAVCLDTDRQAVEDALEANPNIRLLIIDPISNYLGKVSMVAEQEVRSVLTPIMQMAERRGVAVILVMHLNKKSDLDAIMRVGGAMAFVGVSRCSWLFAKNVQEPDGEDITAATDQHRDAFSMLLMKNNLAPFRNTGLSYSIAVNNVRMQGVDVPTPYIKWGTTFDGTADAALASSKQKSTSETPRGRLKTKMQESIDWLEAALQDGEKKSIKQLKKDAKEGFNISPNTLDDAYKKLKGKPAWKVGKDWFWQLPPMNEVGKRSEDIPQQTNLVSVEGVV